MAILRMKMLSLRWNSINPTYNHYHYYLQILQHGKWLAYTSKPPLSNVRSEQPENASLGMSNFSLVQHIQANNNRRNSHQDFLNESAYNVLLIWFLISCTTRLVPENDTSLSVNGFPMCNVKCKHITHLETWTYEGNWGSWNMVTAQH